MNYITKTIRSPEGKFVGFSGQNICVVPRSGHQGEFRILQNGLTPDDDIQLLGTVTDKNLDARSSGQASLYLNAMNLLQNSL